MSKLGDIISEDDMMNAKTSICEVFEGLLEKNDLTIPDDERESYGNEEEQARLFGEAYYEVEDAVEKIIENIELENSEGLNVNKVLEDTKDCRKINAKKPKDITDLLGRFNVLSNLLDDAFCRSNIYKFKDVDIKDIIKMTDNSANYNVDDTTYSDMGILRILILNDMTEEDFDNWMDELPNDEKPDITKLSDFNPNFLSMAFPFFVVFNKNSLDDIFSAITEVRYQFDFVYLIIDNMKKDNFDYEELKTSMSNSCMSLIINDSDLELEPTMQANIFGYDVDIVELN